MSAVERLDEIEARMNREVPALDLRDRNDLRRAVAALRAVLAVHAPNNMPLNRCTEDRVLYAYCPTVRAITEHVSIEGEA